MVWLRLSNRIRCSLGQGGRRRRLRLPLNLLMPGVLSISPARAVGVEVEVGEGGKVRLQKWGEGSGEGGRRVLRQHLLNLSGGGRARGG